MPTTLSPRLFVETIDAVTVVGFAESTLASETTFRELVEALSRIAEHLETRSLLLDFENVQFMSARMLGVLIWVARIVERNEGSMKLCGVKSQLLDHFEITRLHRYFEIYRDRPSALRAFAKPQLVGCAP